MGEIVPLTWAGIDLIRHSVTVLRSKNGERRTIPANQTVLGLLGEKQAIRHAVTDLVFHSRTGTPLDGSNIRRCLTSALKTAKVQDLHFHELRHTFVT